MSKGLCPEQTGWKKKNESGVSAEDLDSVDSLPHQAGRKRKL
jgi:hypothetical protein